MPGSSEIRILNLLSFFKATSDSSEKKAGPSRTQHDSTKKLRKSFEKIGKLNVSLILKIYLHTILDYTLTNIYGIILKAANFSTV